MLFAAVYSNTLTCESEEAFRGHALNCISNYTLQDLGLCQAVITGLCHSKQPEVT